MVAAYLLIRCEPGKVSSVLKSISKAKGVKCADAVAGPYDIVAYAEGDNINTLGKLVTTKIQTVSGVRDTLTCIAVEVN